MAKSLKNVAHILPWRSIGGTEQATARIAHALAPHYRSKVFCLSDATELSRMFSADGFESIVYHPPTPSYRYLHKFLRDSYVLAQQFKDNQIEIVHCADVLAGYYAAVAGRMANVPVLCHVRNRYEDLAKRDAIFLRAVNKFIFVSRDTHRSFAYRLPARKVEVIYDGICVSQTSGKTRVAREAKKAVCEEFGISQDARIVGMVARVAAQKDYETLAKAATRIVAAHPKARFLIVGDNALEQVHRDHYRKIKQILGELNIEPAFVFTGFRKDVGRLIDALDVFVLSTHLEGFPLVILEALARAKPVVATAVDGIPEIIIDDVTGLLSPPRDDRRLAEQVISLLDSEERAHRLATAGRQVVEQTFSAETFAANILELYERVLHGNTRRKLFSSHPQSADFRTRKQLTTE